MARYSLRSYACAPHIFASATRAASPQLASRAVMPLSFSHLMLSVLLNELHSLRSLARCLRLQLRALALPPPAWLQASLPCWPALQPCFSRSASRHHSLPPRSSRRRAHHDITTGATVTIRCNSARSAATGGAEGSIQQSSWPEYLRVSGNVVVRHCAACSRQRHA